ncbi:MAG: dihydrodipicolinate synthase family protein [Clostridia bacterium]
MKQALQRLHEGIFISAMPLVLTADRQLDEAGQRRLIRYYFNAGVGGLAVAVHTTQFEIRDSKHAMLLPVLRLAAEEKEKFAAKTGKSIVLVAGVCGETAQAEAEAQLACSLGYDAALLSPGGLAAFDEAYLLQRTAQVAAILPVIGFYLQPAVGGRVFSFHYWEQFCEIQNVVAIKAAAFDRYLTMDVARAATLSSRADQIALYTGNDDHIVLDLLTQISFEHHGKTYHAHFCGGLLGHWAVWTHRAVELFEEIKRTAKEPAIPAQMLTLAAQITDANAAFFDTANGFKGCIAGIHWVLQRQGLMQNIFTLNQQEALSAGQAEEMARVYAAYPALNDDAFVKVFLKDDCND